MQRLLYQTTINEYSQAVKDKTDLDRVKKKINEKMAENPIGSTELIRLTKGEQVEM